MKWVMTTYNVEVGVDDEGAEDGLGESDLNSDCYVDLLDLAIMANNWLQNSSAVSDWQNGNFAPPMARLIFLTLPTFEQSGDSATILWTPIALQTGQGKSYYY